MPSNEVNEDLRRARWLVWWDKYDMLVYVTLLCVFCVVIGAFGMSFIDRAERMAMAKRHDDEIRDFRMTCRKTVDERDGKVLEATQAATNAAKAVAEVLANEDPLPPGSTPRAVVVAPPKPPRKPPADLGAAVRDANAAITGAQR